MKYIELKGINKDAKIEAELVKEGVSSDEVTYFIYSGTDKLFKYIEILKAYGVSDKEFYTLKICYENMLRKVKKKKI